MNVVMEENQQQQHNSVDNVVGNGKLMRCQKCLHPFSSHVGLFYAFISCMFFAMTTIFVKMLTSKVSAVEILFWRFAVSFMLVVPFLVCVRPIMLVTKKQLLLLLLRTLTGATAIGLLYAACQKIAVGDANAIFFSNPIFTIIFACILLKEGEFNYRLLN